MKVKKLIRLRHFSRIFLFTYLLFQSGFSAAEASQPASGRALGVDSTIPADVLARVTWLTDELRLIRVEKGIQEKQRHAIEIHNASPREVYYKVLALFTKANRLAFEQTGFLEQSPKPIDASAIQPHHVWLIVDKALQRVLTVKLALRIPEKTTESVQLVSTHPDDVYRAVAHANSVINSLLIQQFSPSDVYQQITTSIHLMAQILAGFPDMQRIPLEPAFERRKTPLDVYQLLITCHQLLSKVAELNNKKLLEFENSNVKSILIEPSDVYDLSSLLVANISYFHSIKKTTRPAARAYYPGLKTPSHVYQRAGILKKQLETLVAGLKIMPNSQNQ